jgi:hypothetical protein
MTIRTTKQHHISSAHPHCSDSSSSSVCTHYVVQTAGALRGYRSTLVTIAFLRTLPRQHIETSRDKRPSVARSLGQGHSLIQLGYYARNLPAAHQYAYVQVTVSDRAEQLVRDSFIEFYWLISEARFWGLESAVNKDYQPSGSASVQCLGLILAQEREFMG